jgi:hypothetical protein
MSRTYGRMQGMRGERTVRGSDQVWCKLNTWRGSATMTVTDNEECIISVENLNVRFNGGKLYADPLPPDESALVKDLANRIRAGYNDKDKVSGVPSWIGTKDLKSLKKSIDMEILIRDTKRKVNNLGDDDDK